MTVRRIEPADWLAPDPAEPWYGRDPGHLPNLTVYEPRESWIDTGLVDVSGTAIMRHVAVEPIGFLAYSYDNERKL